jgi:hypothetical protein
MRSRDHAEVWILMYLPDPLDEIVPTSFLSQGPSWQWVCAWNQHSPILDLIHRSISRGHYLAGQKGPR